MWLLVRAQLGRAETHFMPVPEVGMLVSVIRSQNGFYKCFQRMMLKIFELAAQAYQMSVRVAPGSVNRALIS